MAARARGRGCWWGTWPSGVLQAVGTRRGERAKRRQNPMLTLVHLPGRPRSARSATPGSPSAVPIVAPDGAGNAGKFACPAMTDSPRIAHTGWSVTEDLCLDLRQMLVRDTGIEPVTSSVSGKRSPAELIAPKSCLEVETGIEPVCTALQAVASPLGHSTAGVDATAPSSG